MGFPVPTFLTRTTTLDVETSHLPLDCDSHAHTLTIEALLKSLKTDTKEGLPTAYIEKRRGKWGENKIEGANGVSIWKVLMGQLVNALTFVLLGALILSFVVKDYIEAGCILVVIIANTTIGFFQEYRAEKTMESLRQLASPTANVIRKGHQKYISAVELVPGDIIVVKMGDIVPADARLVEVFNLEMHEAMLTGEPEAARKNTETIADLETSLGDRRNMIFSGTVVTKGRGTAIVVGTGMRSQMGVIAKILGEQESDSKTPLQRKLDRFAYALLGLAALLAFIVFAVHKFSGSPEVAMYAISAGIAVIPESLIAVVTVTMALGVRNMAKQSCLVRKMSALEHLGSINHICSDKTGTLTSGKMVVREIHISDNTSAVISGTGVEPFGEVKYPMDEKDGPVVQTDNVPRTLARFATCAALCNMSRLQFVKEDDDGDEAPGWHGVGDGTEVALQVFAHKLQMGKNALLGRYTMISEFPFDSEIKKMSVVVKDNEKDCYKIFCKGAVEQIIKCCEFALPANRNDDAEEGWHTRAIDNRTDIKMIHRQTYSMANRGLRVISLAARMVTEEEIAKHAADKFSQFTREEADKDLIFLGIAGIQDPPRADTVASLKACHTAGITVHMLTGDHGHTAKAIAKEIGILPDSYDSDNDTWGSEAPPVERKRRRSISLRRTRSFQPDEKRDDVVVQIRNPVCIDAREFDKLTEEQIDAFVELPRVISRCSPDTKVNMVAALKRRKAVTAMTGDGVNDAPSLKAADVGIAMGMDGSDVTKSASDLVLTDDNFSTIVQAVSEGRRIYHNLDKFISHLLATNVAEVVALIVGLAFQDGNFAIPPMAPLQILFLNMVTSSPPAIALGMDPASPQSMKQKPRPVSTFLPLETILDTVVLGIIMGALILLSFIVQVYGVGNGNLDSECIHYNPATFHQCRHIFKGRALAFTTATWLFTLHVFACRENRAPIWANGWAAIRGNRMLWLAVLFGISVSLIPLYIPALNRSGFRHVGLSWVDWLLNLAAVLIYFIMVEIYKFVKRIYFGHKRKVAAAKSSHKEMKQRKDMDDDDVEMRSHISI